MSDLKLFKAAIKSCIITSVKIFDQIITPTSDYKKTDIRLPVPYFSSAPGNCGLACIRMFLQHQHIKTPTEKQLVSEYKHNPHYYSNHQGWVHKGLVKILQDFGLTCVAEDFSSLSSTLTKVSQNNPVIVSVQVPSINNLHPTKLYSPVNAKSKNEGHLVVVVGIKGSQVLVHDPRNIGRYRAYTPIEFSVFNKIFSGRCIYAIQ